MFHLNPFRQAFFSWNLSEVVSQQQKAKGDFELIRSEEAARAGVLTMSETDQIDGCICELMPGVFSGPLPQPKEAVHVELMRLREDGRIHRSFRTE